MIKSIPFEFTLPDLSVISGSAQYDAITRKVTFPSDSPVSSVDTSALIGAPIKVDDEVLLLSFGNEGWTADPESIWKAKLMVENAGFEVVKDEDSDYYRWQSKFETVESGLYDTDDEAYLGCVEICQLGQD
ncbi:hypothetical protein ACI2KR_06780 [Pseudomonas luteola]